jgi:hypothetical protein
MKGGHMPLQNGARMIGCRENYKPDEPGVLLELKVIPQQRETPRRHDNKIIARATNQDYRVATSGNREARKRKKFLKKY